MTTDFSSASIAKRLWRDVHDVRFESFGCAVRGLHADDESRTACSRCSTIPATANSLSAKEAVPFDDDRGRPSAQTTRGWPHRRWVIPEVGLHRANAPAIEAGDVQAWFRDGACHRDNAPAIVHEGGNVIRVSDGLPHREGAPAVAWGGDWEWWRDGALHRDDGPARYTQYCGYEYFAHGEAVSRMDLWCRWVALHTDIDEANGKASSWLAMVELKDDESATFPTPDPSWVAVAQAMHPNVVRAAPASASTRREALAGDGFDPSLASPKAELWPPRVMHGTPPVRSVEYERAAFRAALGSFQHATSLGEELSEDDFVRRWCDPDMRRNYISADVQHDPEAVEFAVNGVARYVMRRGLDRLAKLDRSDPPLYRRVRHAALCHDHAGSLAREYLTAGGFPELAPPWAPDKAIADPVERAFEFAARCIAGGVDDILARAWATGMVVAAGLDKQPFWWAGDTCNDPSDEWLAPRRSLATDFYARAVTDLRRGRDATRFMFLVARVYSARSSVADRM